MSTCRLHLRVPAPHRTLPPLPGADLLAGGRRGARAGGKGGRGAKAPTRRTGRERTKVKSYAEEQEELELKVCA